MDYRSDRLSSHRGVRLSSSLPGQRWSQLTAAPRSVPVVETIDPSHQASLYRHRPTLDDSARAYRATALRQLNGSHGPRNRQATYSGNRSSTLASQPVLVRSYPSTDDTRESSKMPSRRTFPFTGGSGAQKPGADLPSDEDFSIDGILRAIEPDIRSTLEAIGEICGRSKLSLANEYGSHIAPLGEIRAPSGGLLTVEEASSDHERQPDDAVDTTDADARDHISAPRHRYREHLGPSAVTSSTMVYQSFAPFSIAERSPAFAEPDSLQSILATNLDDASNPIVESLPTREFASKPNSNGRILLAKKTESATDDQIKSILTPALVAEILLDAQSNSRPSSGERGIDDARARKDGKLDKSSVLTDLQALFNWLRNASGGQPRSAEKLLREMLERQNEQRSSMNMG